MENDNSSIANDDDVTLQLEIYDGMWHDFIQYLPHAIHTP